MYVCIYVGVYVSVHVRGYIGMSVYKRKNNKPSHFSQNHMFSDWVCCHGEKWVCYNRDCQFVLSGCAIGG